MTLECVGEVMQELDEVGGGVIGEIQRQTTIGKSFGSMRVYCFGFFGDAAAFGARRVPELL